MSPGRKHPKRPSKSKAPKAARIVDAGLFEAAFYNSPALQSVLRASDGAIVEVNDAFLQKFGRTREQVIGKSPIELNSWVEPDKLQEYRHELETKGFVRNREVRLRAEDGTIFTALLSTLPVQIDGVLHYLSAGVDITLRKEAEAKLFERERQLRESEARFSMAFQTSPVLMTIARLKDARFVEVNPAFLQLLGLPKDQVLGKNSLELGLWLDAEARTEFFRRLNREGVLRNVECQVRDGRGIVRTMQVSAEIMEIGGESHLIAFALDITRNKQAEADLQHALEKERELNQLKSDFVSLVSHEFRTPLEIILSSADNLERYHERLPAEKRDQLLRTIHKSVRRMSGMMEEVLVLGRMESGKIDFKPVRFDLASFCRRLADEIQTATGHRCPIEVLPTETLPTAYGDENLLRHILTNLLSNAVKYSAEGRAVTLAAAKDAHDAILRVVDRGCGIPTADQPRLFQAFHRGSNVRQVPGTGLGLVIVRRCVELHGGTIEWESTEGRGSAFTVRLRLFPEVSEQKLTIPVVSGKDS